MGIDPCEFDPLSGGGELPQQPFQLLPRRGPGPVEAGVQLQLHLHRPPQGMGFPGQVGQQTRPPHRKGEIGGRSGGQGGGKGISQDQEAAGKPCLPQGEALRHVGDHQRRHPGQRGEHRRDLRKTQPVGVPLEHRQDRRARSERRAYGRHIGAERRPVHDQTGVAYTFCIKFHFAPHQAEMIGPRRGVILP